MFILGSCFGLTVKRLESELPAILLLLPQILRHKAYTNTSL